MTFPNTGKRLHADKKIKRINPAAFQRNSNCFKKCIYYFRLEQTGTRVITHWNIKSSPWYLSSPWNHISMIFLFFCFFFFLTSKVKFVVKFPTIVWGRFPFFPSLNRRISNENYFIPVLSLRDVSLKFYQNRNRSSASYRKFKSIICNAHGTVETAGENWNSKAN